VSAQLDVSRWDPSDPAFRADPYAWYGALRRDSPVHYREDVGWVVSRFDDVEAILRDDRFQVATPSPWREAVAAATSPALGLLGEHSLLFLDAPDHTRVRSAVSGSFSRSRIARLRDQVSATVDHLLDQVDDGEDFDLVKAVAEPLPTLTVTSMLGVPDADWSQLHSWTVDITGFDELPIAWDKLAAADAAATEFKAYCDELLAERRQHPGDDLVSALVASTVPGGGLDDDEVVALLMLLLIAGHDTTLSLVSSGINVLLEHPGEAERLRADPGLVVSAIDELLRFESPLQVASGGGRWPTEPVTMHGITMEPGTPVRLLLGSANRDPDAYEAPEVLDLSRQGRPHLAFGRGTHFCLGSVLGKLEAQVAIPKILDRFPHLTRAVEKVEWRPSFTVRQLTGLMVRP